MDLIPKQVKGTVRELLQKVNPNFMDIAEQLQLSYFLDTDITQVSGGELQRVAIAATALKQANFYLSYTC